MELEPGQQHALSTSETETVPPLPEVPEETEITTPAEKPPFKRWMLFLPLLLVLGGIGAIAFQRLSDPGTEEVSMAETARLPVRVVSAKTAPIAEWVFGDGYVSAVRYKHLTFEVSGTIEYVKQVEGRDLREGDRVVTGELLARLDDRRLMADLRQAEASRDEAFENVGAAIASRQQAQANVLQSEASIQEALAGVEQQRAELRRAEAGVDQSLVRVQQAQAQLAQMQAELVARQSDLDTAQSQYDRYDRLYRQGIIAAAELDEYRNARDSARAAVDAARAQIQSARDEISAAQSDVAASRTQVSAAQSAISAAESQVQAARSNVTAMEEGVFASDAQVQAARSGTLAAEAQVTRSNVTLEDTQAVAPFDGIIAYLNIREGDYWSPQRIRNQDYQAIVETVPIVVIDPSAYEVEVELPAFEGSKVEVGQRVLVVLEKDTSAASDPNMTGEKLVELSAAEGTVFSVSPSVTPGERSIRITVRVDEGNANLQHGGRVAVWIAVEERPAATVVPTNTIVFRDRQPYVFAVNSDGIIEQRSVALGISGISHREIVEGIRPGELLVTEGKNRLVDGTPVEAIE